MNSGPGGRKSSWVEDEETALPRVRSTWTVLRTSVGCPWRVGRLHPPSQETSPAAKQNQNHWKASGAGKGMGVGAKELHAWGQG